MSWTLAGATLDTSNVFDLSSQSGNPRGLFFKPDGTKMYVVDHGTSNHKVYQYTLSTPWDLTTASYSSVSLNVTMDSAPIGLYFSPDGTRMFLMGGQFGTDQTYKYTLSSAWDLSTASYTGLNGVGAGSDLFLKDDGTKEFLLIQGTDRLNEYHLSTAWDPSSTGSIVNFAAGPGTSVGVAFQPDGLRFWIVGSGGPASIWEFHLTTAWDLSAYTVPQTLDISGTQTSPGGLAFSDSAGKLFTCDFSDHKVRSWSLVSDAGGWRVGMVL